MRLICVGSIKDDKGWHQPGSIFEIHDVGEAARLVRCGAARYAEAQEPVIPVGTPESQPQAAGSTETTPPPPSSEPVAPVEPAAPAPDLAKSLADAKIPGINAKVLEALKEAGIETLAELSTFTAPELLAIDGIGPATADKIVEFFQGKVG